MVDTKGLRYIITLYIDIYDDFNTHLGTHLVRKVKHNFYYYDSEEEALENCARMLEQTNRSGIAILQREKEEGKDVCITVAVLESEIKVSSSIQSI